MSETFEVDIDRVAAGGTVGRLDDGRVVFVRHAIPGERVRVVLTQERSRFTRGDAIEVLSPSSHRVKAPCAYAHPEGCGGCDLQHVAPEYQLQWKADVVKEQFQRLAHLEVDVEVKEVGPALSSRTRLRCGVDEDGRLGLRQHGSDEIVPLAGCHVFSVRGNEAFMNDWDGAREVEIRVMGDSSFAVVTLNDGSVVTATLDGLIDEEPQRSIVEVNGERFRVSPLSFWQSHVSAPEILTKHVLEMSKVRRGGRIVDLFSGVGLFAVPLAQRVGADGRVIAVESSPSSAADARRNVADLAHVTVVEQRVTPRLIRDTVDGGTTVVLDPPRSGAGIPVMEALAQARPERIVYVSCDAATLARDCRVLVDAGWTLSQLRAFDLFPMTEHVELVAALDRPR